MKLIISICGLAVMLGLTGCSTPRTVSSMKGSGVKQVFSAPFDPVWRATIDAAQHDNLTVTRSDREHGYIAAQRGLRPETFGENVGIWVTSLSPTTTEVEVVSRQRGPPVLWMKNWEQNILGSVAVNLTRESTTAVGGVAPGTYTTQGSDASQSREAIRSEAQIIEQQRQELRDEVNRLQRQLEDARRRLWDLDRNGSK